MSQRSIHQFACTREKNICPVCGKYLGDRKPYAIPVESSINTTQKQYICNMLYCRNCDLPFIDSDIGKTILEATGCLPKFFVPNKNCSAESVRQQMFHQKKQHASQPRKLPSISIELIQRSTVSWKTVKKISTLPVDHLVCPKCSSALVGDYALLPVSVQENAKIPGQSCRNCGIIYVQEDLEVKLDRLMRDNPLSKGYTLDGRELWNASAVEKERLEKEARKQRWTERKRRLQAIPSAVVMICTRENGKINEYIITNNSVDSNTNDIFCYKSMEGRELLSAAFAPERERKGCLNNAVFKVVGRPIFREDVRSLPEFVLPTQLMIKTDGGYYSSALNRKSELVDLLAYSPFSQRYELMRATYNKGLGYCYADIGIFRSFVRKYGNPGLAIDFDSPSSNSFSRYDLRSESVLMGYGYSVSEANGLSDRERQEILAEIVDLEILTVHQIVGLLNFFSTLHSGTRYALARSKWERDRIFIENYKVNPNRFLIARTAKSIRKDDNEQEM